MRKCYDVECLTKDGKTIHEGVITDGFDAAASAAIKSLKEGRHLDVEVLNIYTVEAI